MSTATLNGQRVTEARVWIPAWGAWSADVAIDVEAELSGPVTLTLADMTLSGTVLSGGPSRGRSDYRVAAGAAGWGSVLPAKGYANDLGVKYATVLGDAATEAGETLDATTIPSGTVGPAYVREEGPASRSLERLSPRAWYVREDGTTRIGARSTVTYTGKATRIETDLARGVIKLAADEIATLLPGATVDGIEAVDVLHELGPAGLRSTVWGQSDTSRALDSMRRLVLQAIPDYRYHAPYEYRVVSIEGSRYNLQPVRASLGMPDLRRVRVRPGVAGCEAKALLGSLVVVQFVNGDPARPIVTGFDDAESPGHVGTTTSIEASVSVALETLMVLLGSPAATDPVMLSTQLLLWIAQANAFQVAVTALLAPSGGPGGVPVVTLPQTPPTVPWIPFAAVPAAATKVRAL